MTGPVDTHTDAEQAPIEVTPAQILAAQTLVRMAREDGLPVDEATLAIANAQPTAPPAAPSRARMTGENRLGELAVTNGADLEKALDQLRDAAHAALASRNGRVVVLPLAVATYDPNDAPAQS